MELTRSIWSISSKSSGSILFVYSIGLQVGPSFFSSFKKGGVKLNMLATAIVFLGVIAAYIVHLATGLHITTVSREFLSGAVTNTPGLGAAQQAYADMTGIDAPDIATGYAVAYPLGVIGIILSMLFIRWIFRIRFDEENKILSSREDNSRQAGPRFGRSQKPVSRRQNRSADQTPDKPLSSSSRACSGPTGISRSPTRRLRSASATR